jgi:uncharacterized protein (DUF427 family)
MMHRTPRIPDATHPISIEAEPKRIIVMANSVALVDTRNALRLREASYPFVHYFLRSDVDMSQLQRSDHMTYCPYVEQEKRSRTASRHGPPYRTSAIQPRHSYHRPPLGSIR